MENPKKNSVFVHEDFEKWRSRILKKRLLILFVFLYQKLINTKLNHKHEHNFRPLVNEFRPSMKLFRPRIKLNPLLKCMPLLIILNYLWLSSIYYVAIWFLILLFKGSCKCSFNNLKKLKKELFLNFLRKKFEKIEKKNPTWYHGASRQITWYHVMSRCITRDITSDHVIATI